MPSTSSATRTVPASVAWSIASRTLSRMACMEANLADEHNHAECIRDDVSFAADLQLRLLAAVAANDDDLILARLEDLRAALDYDL